MWGVMYLRIIEPKHMEVIYDYLLNHFQKKRGGGGGGGGNVIGKHNHVMFLLIVAHQLVLAFKDSLTWHSFPHNSTT